MKTTRFTTAARAIMALGILAAALIATAPTPAFAQTVPTLTAPQESLLDEFVESFDSDTPYPEGRWAQYHQLKKFLDGKSASGELKSIDQFLRASGTGTGVLPPFCSALAHVDCFKAMVMFHEDFPLSKEAAKSKWEKYSMAEKLVEVTTFGADLRYALGQYSPDTDWSEKSDAAILTFLNAGADNWHGLRAYVRSAPRAKGSSVLRNPWKGSSTAHAPRVVVTNCDEVRGCLQGIKCPCEPAVPPAVQAPEPVAPERKEVK